MNRENDMIGSSSAFLSSMHDWKSQIKCPPANSRYRTEIDCFLSHLVKDHIANSKMFSEYIDRM